MHIYHFEYFSNIIIIASYAYLKTDVLINRSKVYILQHLMKNHVNQHEEFSFENGFNIAVAFTSYNNDEEYELKPEYGHIQFRSMEWGID